MLRDAHLNDDWGGSGPSPCSRSPVGPASSLGPTEVGGFQGLSEHRCRGHHQAVGAGAGQTPRMAELPHC